MPAFSERFRVRKRFDLLTNKERRAIHDAALRVMETTGVRIHSKAARGDLERAGAVVEDKPPGRANALPLPMDGSHFYTTTDGCGIAVWDATSGTRRTSVLEDIRRTAVIGGGMQDMSRIRP